MTKDAVTDWDTTASNNADVGGIGIQGTDTIKSGDNALREIMAQIATWITSATFTSTDTGAGVGPSLILHRNSASPADDDILGEIKFDGEDDGSNQTTYGRIYAQAKDVTDTEEDGAVFGQVMIAGTLTALWQMDLSGFHVNDPADPTKQFLIDVSNVTTATERTLALPDANVTITAAAATVLDDTSVSAMRTTLGAVGTVNVQVFTSSGTYTPTSGMVYCIIECVGGGGGGGSAVIASVGYSFHGGGGGGGGYSRKRATAADIGASKTVTIGAGGGGGSGSGLNNGAAGGDTSVDTLCVGKGGSGGQYGSIGQLAVGGAGGVAGTGDVTATGGAGQAGVYVTSGGANNILMGGQGGNSALGAGGKAVLANSAAAAGNDGTGYGGGGAGAGANNSASASASGGDGANGIVIVTEFVA